MYYMLLLIHTIFLVNGLIARLTTGIQRKRVGAWMGYNLARTRKTGPLIFITQTYTHILGTEKSAFFFLKFPPRVKQCCVFGDFITKTECVYFYQVISYGVFLILVVIVKKSFCCKLILTMQCVICHYFT